MKTTAILFDLDGTLYPIDTIAFEKHYGKTLADAAEKAGYPRQAFLDGLAEATKAIKNNDGSRYNREVFIESYRRIFGHYDEKTDAFFNDYFSSPAFLPPDSAKNPLGEKIVHKLKQRGFTLVLATNPFSPRTGTLARLQAAGMKESDFELITVMENSRYCKPKLEYYREIAATIKKQPEECLMVGNDITEDMIAAKIGMKTFLVTDHLTNRNGEKVTGFDSGTMKDFESLSETL